LNRCASLEKGSVLVAALLMLLLLSLLTLMGLQNSALEERTSNDLVRHDRLNRAAESGVAYLEQRVRALFSEKMSCPQRDAMGVWRSELPIYLCLQRSIVPCSEGWCGPQAEAASSTACSHFNADREACWEKMPELPSAEVHHDAIRVQGAVELKGCLSSDEEEALGSLASPPAVFSPSEAVSSAASVSSPTSAPRYVRCHFIATVRATLKQEDQRGRHRVREGQFEVSVFLTAEESGEESAGESDSDFIEGIIKESTEERAEEEAFVPWEE
jgi:hypothetical protein